VTRYELLERIGVGGMAEIFRGKAVAAGGFEKPVAIKRILPHLSQDRRFVELLIAEAKVLSLLKHRNIVQIFDVGLGDDGQYFLVMEYVDGKDMGAVQRTLETKRRRLPFDLCLHIGAEICEALEHAHTSRGPDGRPMALVHRDVSPSNVLLSRAGEIKLTDFGIAKRAESETTRGGAVRGKFAYIAPEQARNEPLDPRGDVFSVGILLWELVCNRRLFSGLDDMAALRAVRDPQIPRPTEVDSRLPREIDDILMSALAKDKAKRIASSGQLGQRLRALRYSLAETSGDPGTELAKIIDSTEQAERESQKIVAIPRKAPSGRNDFDGLGGESTVIRIRTADAFSANDDNSISLARMAIDHFEEEQTRQATLTSEQLRMLRGGRSTAPPPVRGAGIEDDDMTAARSPLDATVLDSYDPSQDTPPHQRLTPTDETRMVAPRDRRSPVPTPAAPAAPAAKPAPATTTALRPRAMSEPRPVPQPAAPALSPQPQPQPPQQQTASPPLAPPSAQPPLAYQPPPRFPGWVPPPVAYTPPQTTTRTLQPWVLVVGALVMAALAFAITRAAIG
jgi:serine/threonine-protein kinase